MQMKTLSINDFMRTYNVGLTFTYALLARGELKAVKAGRKTLILAESADAWLASQPAFVPSVAVADARAA